MITLTELLTAYEAERSADRGGRGHEGLTASALGGCIRRVAYERSDEQITNERPTTSVATVGSLLHDAVAPLYQKHGYVTEVTGANGTSDAIKDNEVRDLKSVTRSRFDAWDRVGPPESVWKQAHVYGHDQGATEGWVMVIDALCRETGRTATYTMGYDPDLAAEALAELAQGDQTIAKGLPVIPDNRYGHGDPVCDNCPFLDACWGEQPDHGIFDGSDIEMFALEYLDASAAKKEADTRMKIAKARLATAQGQYGSVKVGWTDVKERHVEYDAAGYKKLSVKRV